MYIENYLNRMIKEREEIIEEKEENIKKEKDMISEMKKGIKEYLNNKLGRTHLFFGYYDGYTNFKIFDIYFNEWKNSVKMEELGPDYAYDFWKWLSKKIKSELNALEEHKRKTHGFSYSELLTNGVDLKHIFSVCFDNSENLIGFIRELVDFLIVGEALKTTYNECVMTIDFIHDGSYIYYMEDFLIKISEIINDRMSNQDVYINDTVENNFLKLFKVTYSYVCPAVDSSVKGGFDGLSSQNGSFMNPNTQIMHPNVVHDDLGDFFNCVKEKIHTVKIKHLEKFHCYYNRMDENSMYRNKIPHLSSFWRSLYLHWREEESLVESVWDAERKKETHDLTCNISQSFFGVRDKKLWVNSCRLWDKIKNSDVVFIDNDDIPLFSISGNRIILFGDTYILVNNFIEDIDLTDRYMNSVDLEKIRGVLMSYLYLKKGFISLNLIKEIPKKSIFKVLGKPDKWEYMDKDDDLFSEFLDNRCMKYIEDTFDGLCCSHKKARTAELLTCFNHGMENILSVMDNKSIYRDINVTKSRSIENIFIEYDNRLKSTKNETYNRKYIKRFFNSSLVNEIDKIRRKSLSFSDNNETIKKLESQIKKMLECGWILSLHNFDLYNNTVGIVDTLKSKMCFRYPIGNEITHVTYGGKTHKIKGKRKIYAESLDLIIPAGLNDTDAITVCVNCIDENGVRIYHPNQFNKENMCTGSIRILSLKQISEMSVKALKNKTQTLIRDFMIPNFDSPAKDMSEFKKEGYKFEYDSFKKDISKFKRISPSLDTGEEKEEETELEIVDI